MTSLGLVAGKKRKLDALRKTLRQGGLDELDRSHGIDITFTSNALEGNTLTAGETALVLEKGITVSGKPLKDHLEAIDHAHALAWVTEIAAETAAIGEGDIRNLHRLVVAKSNPDIAGRYADRPRYVNTDRGIHHFPSAFDVPGLMHSFCGWLETRKNTPQTAFDAHRKLVAIHPFNDGNGRTARLLMNLFLMRGGYPAIAIRPDDRPAYLAALETGRKGEGHAAFDELMLRRLDQTLDMYIDAAMQSQKGHAGTARIIPMRK